MENAAEEYCILPVNAGRPQAQVGVTRLMRRKPAINIIKFNKIKVKLNFLEYSGKTAFAHEALLGGSRCLA